MISFLFDWFVRKIMSSSRLNFQNWPWSYLGIENLLVVANLASDSFPMCYLIHIVSSFLLCLLHLMLHFGLHVCIKGVEGVWRRCYGNLGSARHELRLRLFKLWLVLLSLKLLELSKGGKLLPHLQSLLLRCFIMSLILRRKIDLLSKLRWEVAEILIYLHVWSFWKINLARRCVNFDLLLDRILALLLGRWLLENAEILLDRLVGFLCASLCILPFQTVWLFFGKRTKIQRFDKRLKLDHCLGSMVHVIVHMLHVYAWSVCLTLLSGKLDSSGKKLRSIDLQ